MISELRYAMRSAPTMRPIGQQRAETRAHAGGGNGREWDGILFQVWCVSQLIVQGNDRGVGLHDSGTHCATPSEDTIPCDEAPDREPRTSSNVLAPNGG
jgi:hypothetical protein